MSDYRPYQHIAQPQGERHKVVYASVELWIDKPPDALIIGGYRWVRDDESWRSEKNHLHS